MIYSVLWNTSDIFKSIYIPRGFGCKALNRGTQWEFQLLSTIHAGSHVKGGDIFVLVQENSLIKHKIKLNLNALGTVVRISKPGNYHIEDVVLDRVQRRLYRAYAHAHMVRKKKEARDREVSC